LGGVGMVLEWRWELGNMVEVGLVRERGFCRGNGDWKRGVEACFLSGWRWRLARCVVVFDGFRCVGKRELRRVNSVIEEMGCESCRGCETSFLSREELRKFLILLNDV